MTLGVAAVPTTSSRSRAGAAASPGVIEQFRCLPLATTLTRSSCAARHRRGKKEWAGQAPKGSTRMVDATCHACELGAAHAREETPSAWPDGAAIELVQLRLPAAPSVSTEAETTTAKTEPAPPAREVRMRGTEYELDGEKKTIAEWSRDPRCHPSLTVAALGMRLRGGWALVDALALPKGSTRPGGGPKGEPKKPAPKTKRAAPQSTPKATAKPAASAARATEDPFDEALGVEIAAIEAELLRVGAELEAARAYRAARAAARGAD